MVLGDKTTPLSSSSPCQPNSCTYTPVILFCDIILCSIICVYIYVGFNLGFLRHVIYTSAKYIPKPKPIWINGYLS